MPSDSDDILVGAEDLEHWAEKCRRIARELEERQDVDGAAMMWTAASLMDEKLEQVTGLPPPTNPFKN